MKHIFRLESSRFKAMKFLLFIYQNSSIYLNRKKEKFRRFYAGG